MPYSKNPHLPKLRMEAVNLVIQGWSIRKVARHFGVQPSTVLRWKRKDINYGMRPIPTLSSRPKRSPLSLPLDIVEKIVEERKKRNRCAEVVHESLRINGVVVSLSSVKRTLERRGLIRERSPWKRWHNTFMRPEAVNPGDLVQMDTIHIQPKNGLKFYIYTLIDLYSRWTYAKAVAQINTRNTIAFTREAQRHSPFTFRVFQTDHGSEFSTHFTERIGLPHRHSRVRQSNDNAHIERFNRTLQEEALDHVPQNLKDYQYAIRKYLRYYNEERLHLGLKLKIPMQVLRSY